MKKLNSCPGSQSQFIKYTMDGESASRLFWFPNCISFPAVKKPKHI